MFGNGIWPPLGGSAAVAALALVSVPVAFAAPGSRSAEIAPPEVVPAGAALDRLVRSAPSLIVGARNEPRAAALFEAAGRAAATAARVRVARAFVAREAVAGADEHAEGAARAVRRGAEGVSERIEPLPLRKEYAFTDPLASPSTRGTSTPWGRTRRRRAARASRSPCSTAASTRPPRLRRAPEHAPVERAERPLNGEDYHGTMVSSTAAAALNGVGAEGIYPAAALRSYDFDYSTAESYYGGFAAASRAGPSVINMSFGGTETSRADYEAIIASFADGSLPVAAAGNEYQEGNPTSYPGAYPHVLTVAATDQTGAPASFSSSGPQVDLAAPGVAIPVQDPNDPRRLLPRRRHELRRADRLGRGRVGDDRAARWRRRNCSSSSAEPRATPPRRAGTSEPATASSTSPRSSAPLPAVDPLEPNDDVDQVAPAACSSTRSRRLTEPASIEGFFTSRTGRRHDRLRRREYLSARSRGSPVPVPGRAGGGCIGLSDARWAVSWSRSSSATRRGLPPTRSTRSAARVPISHRTSGRAGSCSSTACRPTRAARC